MNQLLTKTFSNIPVVWRAELSEEYKDLGEALNQMTELNEDASAWGIERPVYEVACFVATGLLANSFPAPRVFNHGPQSVVFNWSEQGNNLYLTVSADRISALISTPERIQKRLDYSVRELVNPTRLLGAIRSAQVEQPVLTPTSATSDPSEVIT